MVSGGGFVRSKIQKANIGEVQNRVGDDDIVVKEKEVEAEVLKKCLIGYVKELDLVERLPELCKIEGL